MFLKFFLLLKMMKVFMRVKYDVGYVDWECLQSWFGCLSYCIWRLGWL